MIERIRFTTFPHDDTAQTLAKYAAILESQVEAHRVAIRVAIERGDLEAERYARASLSGLQRRIRELKREAKDHA